MKVEKTKQNELSSEQLERKSKRVYHTRIISCIVFIIAMAGITYLLYPIFKGVGEDNWLASVQESISKYSGISGLLIFLAIQTLQVLVAVIPAIQVVGGMLYGWFLGAIVSFIGIVFGSLLVWGIVKKLGSPIVESVVSEKHLKRFSFLEDDRKLIIILIVLYIIPGIPKDVLTYIVPLTKIKMKSFFLYVMPFRLPSILLSTALGSNVTSGNYRWTMVFIAVIIFVALLGFIFKDKVLDLFSKRKNRTKKDNKEKTL